MERPPRNTRAARAERFGKLIGWQKAYDLVLTVYQLTKSFPEDERFGLANQLRRGAVSIPSNIAEGWGRGARTDYVRFLKIARGATYELQTQLWLAADLDFVEPNDAVHDLADEVGRILNGLIRALSEEPEHT